MYTGPLFAVQVPGDPHFHLARTNIEGAETECGITLGKGWNTNEWTGRKDWPPCCCEECEESIAAVGPPT